ncbi:MAG: hypothetical protein ACTSWN_08195 [Promethearchaeota archaeon]
MDEIEGRSPGIFHSRRTKKMIRVFPAVRSLALVMMINLQF